MLTEYVDRQRGLYRAAAFVDGRLEGALFVGPADAPPQWSDLRHTMDGVAESGPVVCACFGVGLAAIHEAMAAGRGATVADITRALRAGNKCGTCLPELRAIVVRGLTGSDQEEPRHERHAHALAR